MAECYNTACPYCEDYKCKRTATCDMRLYGEYAVVVHGRWIKTELKGRLVCSVCGHYALADKAHKCYVPSNYCPNCGAKMDEVEE